MSRNSADKGISSILKMVIGAIVGLIFITAVIGLLWLVGILNKGISIGVAVAIGGIFIVLIELVLFITGITQK